jgi:hypothetical protein
MTDPTAPVPSESSDYEVTRFNALKHGILSRYTVLPWEDAGEYQILLDALIGEHAALFWATIISLGNRP